MDSLLEDPVPLAAGGALLVAGLAGAWYWRKKRSAKLETSLLGVSTTDTSSVFGTSGGRSVDTGSALQTDFSQSGIGAIDTDEVDPVAEADVYMAYGRDAQAEEILKEALQKDPSRQGVRVKLLEIYAGRKDLKAFETAAGELYAATGGQGPDWEKAAALGRQIDPANTMYGGASLGVSAALAAGAAAVTAAAPAASEPDITLGGEDLPAVDFDIAGTPARAPQPDIPLDASPSAESQPLDLGLDLDLGAGTEPKSDFTAKGTLIMDAATKQALADADQAVTPPSDLGLSIDFELPGGKAGAAGGSAVDFELDNGPRTLPAAGANVDLSTISFDLGTPGGGAPTGDARWQEVATKLDLAKAYEEMGDKDGARELLGEVIKEGDAAQQQQAKTMLEAMR
jgi:pilus assembly protein FimV